MPCARLCVLSDQGSTIGQGSMRDSHAVHMLHTVVRRLLYTC